MAIVASMDVRECENVHFRIREKRMTIVASMGVRECEGHHLIRFRSIGVIFFLKGNNGNKAGLDMCFELG